MLCVEQLNAPNEQCDVQSDPSLHRGVSFVSPAYLALQKTSSNQAHYIHNI